MRAVGFRRKGLSEGDSRILVSSILANLFLSDLQISPYPRFVEGSHFEETLFFSAIAASAVRALLIGRRALIALGLPLLTRDYDFWIHGDDIAAFNAAISGLDLFPNHSPDEARARGRYVLENDEKVDVIVAQTVYTVDSVRVTFDDVWARRRIIEVTPGVPAAIPSLDDLILTKRFGARPKDAEDIRMLEVLRSQEHQ